MSVTGSCESIESPVKSPSGRALAVRGTVWTVAGYGSAQAVRLGARLALTHLVAPKIIGEMALISTMLTAFEMLSEMGITQAVIRSPAGSKPRFLGTAFTIQILRGIVLWSIAVAAAWPFARFYHKPDLLAALMVAGSSSMIAACRSPAAWKLSRAVHLGRLTAAEVASEVVGASVILLWAWRSPGLWALVGGTLAGPAAMALLTYFLGVSAVRPCFDRDAAKAILGFGSGLALSSATWFLASSAEILLLGKLVDPETLGVLSVAIGLVGLAGRAVSQVMSRVVFPLVAAGLHECESVARARYRRARLLMLGLNLPLALGVVGVAPWLLPAVVGSKYAAVGKMVAVVGVRLVFETAQVFHFSMLMTAGAVRYSVWANIARAAWLAIVVPLSLHWWGLDGVVWALGLAAFPSHVLYLIGVRRSMPGLVRGDLACALLLVAWVALLWLVRASFPWTA